MSITNILRAAALLARAGMAAADFCQDYDASVCADAFTDCSGAYAAMDATTQACVATHLTYVDASDSAHCAHARGEGPCESASDVVPVETKSSSGVSLRLAVGSVMVTALVHII